MTISESQVIKHEPLFSCNCLSIIIDKPNVLKAICNVLIGKLFNYVVSDHHYDFMCRGTSEHSIHLFCLGFIEKLRFSYPLWDDTTCKVEKNLFWII